MQAGAEISGWARFGARTIWTFAMWMALLAAWLMAKIGVHKQWANRLIEPFSWHTVIVTATDWDNFYALRCSPMAQPEIRIAAEMMRDAMAANTPTERAPGEWHLPLVDGIDSRELYLLYDIEDVAKISAARCARVSYLTHDGLRNVAADLALYERLASSGHWSPLEHAARPARLADALHAFEISVVLTAPKFLIEASVNVDRVYFGNLRGWVSLRKTVPGESVFVPPMEEVA